MAPDTRTGAGMTRGLAKMDIGIKWSVSVAKSLITQTIYRNNPAQRIRHENAIRGFKIRYGERAFGDGTALYPKTANNAIHHTIGQRRGGKLAIVRNEKIADRKTCHMPRIIEEYGFMCARILCFLSCQNMIAVIKGFDL